MKMSRKLVTILCACLMGFSVTAGLINVHNTNVYTAKAAELAHRNKKWFYPVFAGLLAVFLLPVILVSVITFAFPAVYDDTFVGELGDKYELLNATDEKKVVVIGGSSVAFGLDSAMMEEELGSKVNVVVTGGIARFVIPMCRKEIIYDKDLIIKGLAALYRDNKRK